MNNSHQSQLLFFDTFSHDVQEELNLDLVQFPSPVFVEEVRVIPLGARVQANFPGGRQLRLGATNPATFRLDLFINDLEKPGAAAFESLGALDYSHHERITLQMDKAIPTDGLVLRGMYSAITLAVYGTMSKCTAEQLASQAAALAATSDATTTGPSVASSAIPRTMMGASAAIPGSDQFPAERSKLLLSSVPHNSEWPSSSWPYPDSEVGSARGGYDCGNGLGPERDLDPALRFSPRLNGQDELQHDDLHSSPSSESRSHSRQGHSISVVQGHRSSRSPSSGRQLKRSASPSEQDQTEPSHPSVKDDILDDMSDISEGDIPDVPEDSRPWSRSPSPGHDRFGKFDDVEEISDDEAEWSDEFGDMEAPEDYVDPIKPIDPVATDLVILSKPCLCRDEEDLAEMAALLAKHVPGAATPEFVENVEALTRTIGKMHVTALDDPTKDCLIGIAQQSVDVTLSMQQAKPTTKLRHIKSGLNYISSALKFSEELRDELLLNGLLNHLFTLLNEGHMAASIKLLIIEILDAAATSLIGFRLLSGQSTLAEERSRRSVSGRCCFDQDPCGHAASESMYCQLLRLGQAATTRVKAAIQLVMQKLHLCELLQSLSEMAVKARASAEDEHEVQAALDKILRTLTQVSARSPKTSNPQHFANIAKTEISESEVFQVFRGWSFLHLIYLSVTQHSASPTIVSIFQRTLEEMWRTCAGLNYLLDNCPLLNAILKGMERPDRADDGADDQAVDFATRLSVRLHTAAACRSIGHLLQDRDQDCTSAVEQQLQFVYALTLTPTGRLAVAKVLSMDAHVGTLLRAASSLADGKVVRSYVLELLLMTFRFAEESALLRRDTCVQIAETFPAENNLRELEVRTWVRPALDLGESDSESIGLMCEVIKSNLDRISPMSNELVSACRLLAHLCKLSSTVDRGNVTLGLFSSSMMEDCLTLLTSICGYHEQPSLHTATFVGSSGFLLLDTTHSVVRILRAILQFLISCRDLEFKDSSCIVTLLRTYCLASVAPESSLCNELSRAIRENVVAILLLYTKPSCDMSTEENVSKSMWTRMLEEVFSHAASLPHAFSSGLNIILELLPLPLPVPTRYSVAEDKTTILNHRKLWSAHLYPVESKIREVIAKMMCVSCPLLRRTLGQVCLQLVDLSPPIGVMVGEAILQTAAASENSLLVTCRGLSFLLCLLEAASVKAVLSNLLTESKTLHSLASRLFASDDDGAAMQQAHVHLMRIFLSLCSPAVSDVTTGGLMSRDALEATASLLLSHLSCEKASCGAECLPTAVRTLTLMCDSEVGLHSLRTGLDERPRALLHALSRPHSDAALVSQLLHLVNSMVRPSARASVGRWQPAELRQLLAPEAEQPDVLDELKTRFEANDDIRGQIDSLSSHLNNGEESAPAEGFVNALPRPKTLLELYEQCQLEAAPSDGRLDDVLFVPLTFCASSSDDVLKGEWTALNVMEIAELHLPKELDMSAEVSHVCDEKSLETDVQKKKKKKSALEKKAQQNKSIIQTFRSGGAGAVRGRGGYMRMGARGDNFRARPPNTSRPPSLHVDDFLVLQQRGQQPTGPTGYNKQSIRAAKELFAEREAQQHKGSLVGYRDVTKEPVYAQQQSSSSWYGGERGRGGRHGGERGHGGLGPGPRPDRAGPPYRGGAASGNGNRRSAERGARGWSPTSLPMDAERRFAPAGGGPRPRGQRWPGPGGGPERKGGNRGGNKDGRKGPMLREDQVKHSRSMVR